METVKSAVLWAGCQCHATPSARGRRLPGEQAAGKGKQLEVGRRVMHAREAEAKKVVHAWVLGSMVHQGGTCKNQQMDSSSASDSFRIVKKGSGTVHGCYFAL